MKKQSFFTILLTVFMSMVETNAFAVDIVVNNADGVSIYYNYINDGKELEVTYNGPSYGYNGVIVIPQEVTYMNRTRKVTSIGDYAFADCSGLTSVTIPNSVTSIGVGALAGCSGLTSVTIPNSVTSIGKEAFWDCSRLTSITIPNSVTIIREKTFRDCNSLTSITIPNSVTTIGEYAFIGCSSLTFVTVPNNVTSIGEYAFRDCSSLTSITVPNSVTSIGEYAFMGCNSLTSITIPNSVTSIGGYTFQGCSSLTSVTIGNSVTSIGEYAFYYCLNLTSVTIPNNVTNIGEYAFYYCLNLTSVTIPNSVTSIGSHAFDHCEIPEVISSIENPFDINTNTFSDNTYYNATLYVPSGTIDKYKDKEGWKKFAFIEERNGGGNPPAPSKCEKPTISYQNGKLTFHCATDGAVCHSTITDADITSYNANEVQLNVTYNISAYASKAGYENSDVANATLCWIDMEPNTEGITNGFAYVRASAVLIQSSGNMLTVSGADEGTTISVFDIAGRLAGSAKASSQATYISTSLRIGDIGIVKIGDKTVKVLMK